MTEYVWCIEVLETPTDESLIIGTTYVDNYLGVEEAALKIAKNNPFRVGLQKKTKTKLLIFWFYHSWKGFNFPYSARISEKYRNQIRYFDSISFAPRPLCVFCGSPWSTPMLKNLLAAAGCPTCGDGTLSATLEIRCSNCCRVVYLKEFKEEYCTVMT